MGGYIRTCFVYGSGVMPCRRAGSGIGKYIVESKRFNFMYYLSMTEVEKLLVPEVQVVVLPL